MPKKITFTTFTIVAGGSNELLDVLEDTELYRILPDSGAVTLVANQTFSPTGTPSEGVQYVFEYNGGVTLSGNTLDIFGHQFTDAEALAKYRITCTFIDGIYEVKLAYSANDGTPTVDGAAIQTGTITSTQIQSGSTSLADIAPASGQGFMIKGGVAGVWEEIDSTGAGRINIGQGADVLSLPLSGDVTMGATGAVLVANGAITPEKLSFTIESTLSSNITLSSVQVQALNTSPITMVGAPGAGKVIEVISASAFIQFNTLAYAGTINIDLECQGASVRQFSNQQILGTSISKGSQFLRETTPVTSALSQLIENTALILIQPTGDPTTGNSPVTVSVNYRIINV